MLRFILQFFHQNMQNPLGVWQSCHLCSKLAPKLFLFSTMLTLPISEWIDKGKGIYARAFSQHRKKGRHGSEKLDEWKKALHNVSFYSGHIINKNDDEVRLLKNIVNRVLEVIKRVPLVVAKHPVGLNEAVNGFESVRSHHNEQIVGIWGMGGSGKTTLAKELYNQKWSYMERSSFLCDVRDAASKSLLHNKQRQLLEDLGVKGVPFDSIEQGKGILASRLRSIRLLLILDDVDYVDQLDALLPTMESLGSGSLIIVTTREFEVLRCWGISSIYKMRPLDELNAKQLFCWHAFLRSSPLDGFEELVKKFLAACNGLPLSLKVLGGQLYGKSGQDYWESQLNKISRVLHKDVKQTLKTSYDALDYEEKEIFLDVACFFIGEKNSLAIAVWNGSGWSGLYSWETLMNKCLVELDENNYISMHDQHSPRRLWLPDQVNNVQNEVEKRTGIRGIIATTGRGSTSEIDQGICGLAASSLGLKILVVKGHYFNQVILVSTELLWLRCARTGQRNLPSSLSLKNLRVLELHEGYGEHHLEELWEADGNAPLQLRELVISDCAKFQRFPNSIGCLKYLKKLVMNNDDSYNKKLTSLPDEFCGLLSLEHLQLTNFDKLSSLPRHFGHLTKLEYLDLCGRSSLRMLPVSFKQLTLLHHLDFRTCTELTFNLDIMENMTKLEYLNFSRCKELEELPSHITNQASLRVLNLYKSRLRKLPVDIARLSKLRVMYVGGELLTSLPHSIGNLSSLITLQISDCPKLESLPESVGRLILLETLHIYRSGVQSLPKSLSELDFGQGSFTSSLCNLKEIWLQSTRVSKISISEDCCPSLETVQILFNDNLTEIEALPKTVNHIVLINCKMLNNIRGIGGLVNLEDLRILFCPELQELPSFADLASLKTFDLSDCYKVEKISGLEHCISLEVLRVDTRWEVAGIASLEQMERLRRLQVAAYKRSAVEPCIQTLKKWPGEVIICASAGPDASSQLANAFAFPNLSIVDSIENQKINSRPTLVQKRRSNADTIILCFVINCGVPSLEMYLQIGDGSGIYTRAIQGEGKWVWIGVFTQHSHFHSATATKTYHIMDMAKGDHKVEKALLVMGEERNLMEALCRLFTILGS